MRSVASGGRPAPQPVKLGCVDAGADAAGIDQLSVRTVIGEELRAEIRAASFRIGPADRQGYLNPDNSAAFTIPAR
jgi:hypothetical protein